ncbi:hypothetical protein NUW58_g4684 [Xylaria curta]|uniref:Uncharacterized protein n=1 Tax=Xylaria curta TaxID=42375 RepID=A0ACC1P7K7_9PEZI|nr:hypothetical protein NUW58_g4684 [Xylaria curta]
MYDIAKGSIEIDGQDIQKVTKASLRENIAIVPQTPVFLEDRSIFHNITYGRPNASMTDTIKACRAAQIHKRILMLRGGYDTLMTDARLSQGELQRIAIARALVKDSHILLLDEATSALDANTEYEIQKALVSARKGRTTLIIAHRLSTVKNADTICVLGDGRIIEQGAHNELILKDSEYARLWSKHIGSKKTRRLSRARRSQF